MKLPGFRLSVRRMMIVVAFFALASLGWREYRARQIGADYLDPIANADLNALLADGHQGKHFVPGQPVPYAAGQPVPVTISYNFKLSNPKRSPSALILMTAWFEDVETGKAVDSYSFDCGLAVGGREACSGSFEWEARIPHPGLYQLRYQRYHRLANGEMTGGNGGGTLCDFKEAKP